VIRASYEAFRALVAGLPGVPAVDEVARVTSSGEPVRANYCIVYPPSIPELDDNRYLALQRADSRARHRFDVRPVATTVDGLNLMADALLSVIGRVLVVDGRTCEAARLVDGVEENRARYDPVPRLFYMDLTFEIRSA
jgi:hypothetical protein